MSGVKCYMCQEEITPSNKSEEHIILRSFGGRLSSYALLCQSCNGRFGNGIDSELYKQIPLPTLLKVSLQHGELQKVLLKKKNGIGFWVNDKLKPSQQHPTVIKDGKSLKYYARSIQEARKKFKEFYPNKTEGDFVDTIKWIDTIIDEPLFFNYDLIQNDAYLSICKTAVNYFLYCGGDIRQVEYARFFLTGRSYLNNLVKYYYRDELNSHLLEKEISHTLYLKCNKELGLCYFYIELFSVHCFLVILNRNYFGEDIEEIYSCDLDSGKKLNKEFSLSISRSEIDGFTFPGDSYTEDGYFKRLKRAYDIKGIEMQISKRIQPQKQTAPTERE